MNFFPIFLIFFTTSLLAQNYTEYFTGNETDLDVAPQQGICLMGGASENDQAMQWFLEKANGGDVVILRTSGSDGYNDYFYSQLGVSVNSVTTFVIHNASGATNSYVLSKIANAEAIWFAGGNQYNYVSYFKDNAMELALNNFISVKQGVIGGTSAGMAILGSAYFSAENGTVTSSQALQNPYHSRVTLGYNDFLAIPYLEHVITDTHYDNPDRKGRHSVFLARYANDNTTRSLGIACNEYAAVCIDALGIASVYGEYPNYQEYAYFLQANCNATYLPETCIENTALTWNLNAEALKVYKVPGTLSGSNYFNISDWETGSGGSWENWYVNHGVWFSASTTNPNCANFLVSDFSLKTIRVYPNPFKNIITIETVAALPSKITIIDVYGREIKAFFNTSTLPVSFLPKGIYFLKMELDSSIKTVKLIKN